MQPRHHPLEIRRIGRARIPVSRAPPIDLAADIPFRLSEFREARGRVIDRMELGEHVDEVLRESARLCGGERHPGGKVLSQYDPL